MPRTALTRIAVKGPHPGTVSANDLDFSFTACDVGNKNKFSLTGRQLILVQNVNVGAKTVTFTSVNDPYSRTGTITTYSLGATEFAAFFAGDLTGWQQTDGEFYLEGEHADIKFAIITIPG